MTRKAFELEPTQLYHHCDLSSLSLRKDPCGETNEPIGQERAMQAMRFGLSMKQKGYNIFISGLNGTGRNSYAKIVADEYSRQKPCPDDFCYVFNFERPEEPLTLSLKAGEGFLLKDKMEGAMSKIKREMVPFLYSKAVEETKGQLYRKFEEDSLKIIEALNAMAKDHGFQYEMTEKGLVQFPILYQRKMKEEELKNLPESRIREMNQQSLALEQKAFGLLEQMAELEQNLNREVNFLLEKTARAYVQQQLKEVRQQFAQNEATLQFLDRLIQDIVSNLEVFQKANADREFGLYVEREFFPRYEINLFLAQTDRKHGPVVVENNPNYYNLLGKIEYINDKGLLKTNHMKIKPGSLHEANGGVIIIQAKDLLREAQSWQGLIRALKSEEIKIENAFLEPVVTSIKPKSIPLNVKVILVGDDETYQLLYEYEDNFKKLFKIHADFDIVMPRTQENMRKIISFIYHHCEQDHLKPFTQDALEKMIEYSSRIAGRQEKLTARFNDMVEVIYEADAVADMEGMESVNRQHIERAILGKAYRNNEYEAHLLEYFENGTLLLDTEGEKIGQVNGLAVLDSGQYSFGKPCRITASTYMGKEGIINVEREADQSGNAHDKGMLIITGFLGSRYANEYPLSLNASITFEQSYSLVDGDSASSTELYALLSSLSKTPINQSLAVTGSVDQKGNIQPIGGINEKIEGFFKVCKLRGLNGQQGVIMPVQNVKDLMLDEDVRTAVKEGKFHIYAISNIDEGMSLLTGLPAGEQNEEGLYEEGSINRRVQDQLDIFAEQLEHLEEA